MSFSIGLIGFYKTPQKSLADIHGGFKIFDSKIQEFCRLSSFGQKIIQKISSSSFFLIRWIGYVFSYIYNKCYGAKVFNNKMELINSEVDEIAKDINRKFLLVYNGKEYKQNSTDPKDTKGISTAQRFVGDVLADAKLTPLQKYYLLNFSQQKSYNTCVPVCQLAISGHCSRFAPLVLTDDHKLKKKENADPSESLDIYLNDRQKPIQSKNEDGTVDLIHKKLTLTTSLGRARIESSIRLGAWVADRRPRTVFEFTNDFRIDISPDPKKCKIAVIHHLTRVNSITAPLPPIPPAVELE